MEIDDELRPQNKGEVREIKNRRETIAKVQNAANIIAEHGRQSNASYFVTSASVAEIINQLKEEGEL
jgi:hypothetical protein